MKADYKNPFNLLILLGFICQGFAWENWLLPILFTGIWFLVLKFRSQKQMLSDSIELLIFFLALILSLRFVGHNAYFRLLSMGNALLILQAMRLLSPMNRRKQLIALIIAVTHLAVGSQFIVDYSFILILIFSIILIPRVLYQIQAGNYTENPPLFFGKKQSIYGSLCILMFFFFLLFPRQKLVSGKEAGMIMSQGPMRPRMDTVTGGTSQSTKSILRVKGENVKYLKSFALDTFDGDVWSASYSSRVMDRFFDIKNLEKNEYRHVSVMDLTLIGSTLPVDKHVKYLKGNFFQGGHISAQGSVVISLIWPQNNNYYEYWTSNDKVKELSKKEKIKYTLVPRVSSKLKDWLKGVVGNEKDPEKQVQRIEKFLKDNLTYELGTPDLDRFAPIEDFVFNRKTGHCERFASALALFCRMQKIPSRVVIGYYVPAKNQFADYYNVQVNHGHAWVEAFIPGKGWQTFDATPYSEQVQTAQAPGVMMTIKDWLDYIWYSKVVEFSSNDQNLMLTYLVEVIKRSISFSIRNMTVIVLVLVVAIGFFILGKLRFKMQRRSTSAQEKQAIQLEAAEKFYADMLEHLASLKIYRRINQTPYEFASLTDEIHQDFQDDVNLITESFCLVKYGELPLSLQQLEETTAAVKKLKEQCRKNGRI